MFSTNQLIDEDGEIKPRQKERDARLTFRVSADEDVLAKLAIKPQSEGVMRALLGILGALNQADDRWVSYSRRWAWYVGQQCSYGRYFTYTYVVSAVELLHGRGLIEHDRIRPGSKRERQSSIRATPALLAVLRAESTAYYFAPVPLIVMRDEDKNAIKVPNTREIASMRGNLEFLREAEESIRLKLDAPGVEHTAHHTIVDGNKIPALETPALTRTFSRLSTRCNGRRHAQGGGYQNLPSEYRQQLTMNGDPVGCADFVAMHIALLYAQAGIQLEGDPYVGIAGLTRPEAKIVLLILINAASPTSAVRAIRAHLHLDQTRAVGAYEAVKNRHASIAGYFASDAGIRLMRVESDILIACAVECAGEGIPVLGVHDELLAPLRYLDRVGEIMAQKYFERTGLVIQVRTKASEGRKGTSREAGAHTICGRD